MKKTVKQMLAFGGTLVALYYIFRIRFSVELFNEENFNLQPKTKLRKKENACGESLPITFLKIHKTGSTTMRRILENHIKKKKRELQYEIYELPFPYAGGYPGPFRRDLALVCTSSKSCQLLNNTDRRSDVIKEHYTFNRAEIAKAMKPNPRYVTMMREPAKQFESSFYYYYGNFVNRKEAPPGSLICFAYPYLHVTGGRWVTLSQYITMAENSLNKSSPYFFRSQNNQAFQLGLDPHKMDEKYILQEAKKLDKTFDLVMIFEYMHESLILLKNLLCMDWEDIIPNQFFNAGRYAPLNFTDTETKIVRKLTAQDEILYNYFNATFWRKVDEYGRERMAKDKAKLQRLFDEKFPEAKNMPKERPIIRKPPDGQNIPTRRHQGTEVETMNIMRAILKTRGFRPSDGTAYEIARYMVEHYGWCPTLS